MKLRILAILGIAILFIMAATASADHDKSGMDVVLVIDTSGSMKESDTNRVAIEAAKLFIDMMESNESRVGVIGFSDKITLSIPLTSIKESQDKEKIKQAIEGLTYSDDTDIGLAMTEGNLLLDQLKENSMMLLFTDGRIDFDKKTLQRTQEQSEAEVWEVVNAATGQYPIYTIGLNADQSVDKDLISKMAEKTGANSYIVDSAVNLPNIFNEIFADFINSKIHDLGTVELTGTNKTTIPIKIPNESILEANVIMLSTELLEDIELTNPEGNIETIDNDKVILAKSKNYSLLKIKSPRQGNWFLELNGVKGCKVQINLLFNYDVSLVIDPIEQMEYKPGDDITIRGHLEVEGSPITEEEFYQNFTATVIVEDSNGNSKEFPARINGAEFQGDVQIEEEGEYFATLRVENESFYRISEPVAFKMIVPQPTLTPTKAPEPVPEVPKSEPVKENHNPEFTTGNLDKIEFTGFVIFGKSKNVELSGYANDPDGDLLTYQITEYDHKLVKVVMKDGILQITPKNNGSGKLTILVQDGKGGTCEILLDVWTDVLITSILPIVGGITLLILVLVSFIMLLKRIKTMKLPFEGRLYYTIDLPDQRVERKRYELLFRKGRLRLSEILGDSHLNTKEIKDITIYPSFQDGPCIRIENKSKYRMSLSYGYTESRDATIGDKEYVEFTDDQGANCVHVRLEYEYQNY
ncbi:MAG: von Willebrand factor [Herbinix sp.]|jgi:hypothetical protein|nr:von Willebrand factor [Herbinix sp.]